MPVAPEASGLLGCIGFGAASVVVAAVGLALGRRISGLRRYLRIAREPFVCRRGRELSASCRSACCGASKRGQDGALASAVKSARQALQSMLVGFYAEREGEELVCNIHAGFEGCTDLKSSKFLSKRLAVLTLLTSRMGASIRELGSCLRL